MNTSLLLFISAAFLQLSSAEELSPLTSLSQVDLSRGDIFDGTRAQISKLVNNLNDNGKHAEQLLTDLSDVVLNQREQFDLGIGNITAGIWDAIQNIIGGFLNATVAIPQELWKCVENQTAVAGNIVNETITSGIVCLSSGTDSVLGLINNGISLIGKALTLAGTIVAEVLDCGISNIFNFAQVGICLNKILQSQQTPVVNLIGEIASLVAVAATYIISVPITIGVCISATATTAAIRTTTLVTDLVACGAGGIIDGILQG